MVIILFFLSQYVFIFNLVDLLLSYIMIIGNYVTVFYSQKKLIPCHRLIADSGLVCLGAKSLCLNGVTSLK